MASINHELIDVRVDNKQLLADGIVGLQLQPIAGGLLPAYEPGAHIDVHIPGGFIRQYSIASNPDSLQSYQIAILQEPDSRGGSLAVHEKVAVGDVLQISYPRNRFSLLDSPVSILFAGGIGITPLLPMAAKLKAQGHDFQLHYSVRTRSKAAFLGQLQDQLGSDQFFYHIDNEPATGMDMQAVLANAGIQAHVYICGPAGYIDWISTQVREFGIPADQIHLERFALNEQDRPAVIDQDRAFEVELASTGEVFQIPADESITSALDKEGVFIPVSCEQGICGTCLTGVCGGTPDHRDTYLTEAEHAANDQFTPCVSRSLSARLILDL